MTNKINITGGVYLVVDPAMDKPQMLSQLSLALKAGVTAVQIWNNWLQTDDKQACIAAVSGLCRPYNVPLFIDNDWELLIGSPFLDGVHFDTVPENFMEIKEKISKPFLTGITCSGNLDVVRWADKNGLDYISFCAMFPSASAGSCSIVMPSTVKEASEITNKPLFVSGGLTPENIIWLRHFASFEGVAVISGIMGAGNPYEKVKLYQHALTTSIQNL